MASGVRSDGESLALGMWIMTPEGFKQFPGARRWMAFFGISDGANMSDNALAPGIVCA